MQPQYVGIFRLHPHLPEVPTFPAIFEADLPRITANYCGRDAIMPRDAALHVKLDAETDNRASGFCLAALRLVCITPG